MRYNCMSITYATIDCDRQTVERPSTSTSIDILDIHTESMIGDIAILHEAIDVACRLKPKNVLVIGRSNVNTVVDHNIDV